MTAETLRTWVRQGEVDDGKRPGVTTEAMTGFVDEHRDVYGVEPICHALAFAPSTYYAVKQRQANPSARALRDAELLVEISRVHEHSDAPRRSGASFVARASGSPGAPSSG